MAENTPELLAEVVTMLADVQMKTWLFGGWAEELSGLCSPRPHRDIDLLYAAQSFDRMENFLRMQSSVKEVSAKRFPHKTRSRRVQCCWAQTIRVRAQRRCINIGRVTVKSRRLTETIF